MRPIYYIVASVSILVAATSSSFATVGCEVIANLKGANSADFYDSPDENSEVVREIPIGDIVLYPSDAPAEIEGWVWVRHDITQEDIWQSGVFGWIRAENLALCG